MLFARFLRSAAGEERIPEIPFTKGFTMLNLLKYMIETELGMRLMVKQALPFVIVARLRFTRRMARYGGDLGTPGGVSVV